MPKNLIRFDKENITYLLILAWPAVVEQILQTAVSYVDAAMVGALGAGATAAVAINSPPIWLMNSLFYGIGAGFSIQLAQAVGAQEVERGRGVIRQGILATAAVGVALFVLLRFLSHFIPLWMGVEPDILPAARDYIGIYTMVLPLSALQIVLSFMLRCMGDTRTPLMAGTFANLVNIILNTLLIFQPWSFTLFGKTFTVWGAGLGVAGAAVATAVAILLAGILLLRTMYRMSSPYRLYLGESYRPDREILIRALKLGAPVTTDRAILSAGQIVMTSIAAFLGTNPLAAHHVAITAEALCYLPASGISYAATTVVGQSVGARDQERAGSFAGLAGVMGFITLFCTGVILFIFARPLASIFSPDPEVIELAAGMLRIISIAEPLTGISIVLSGVMQGAGDTRWPFYISVVGMWGIRMALIWLLVFIFELGLAGMWIAMVADLWFRGIVSSIRIGRGKWLAIPDETAQDSSV